jgi:hypothetical protein
MKSPLIWLALSCLSASPAHAASIQSPGVLWTMLNSAFPDLVEAHPNGDVRFTARELSCAIENHVDSNGDGYVTSSCVVAVQSGHRYEAKDEAAANLFFALMNGRLALDSTSEPGTTYAALRDLSCVRDSLGDQSVRCTYNQEMESP